MAFCHHSPQKNAKGKTTYGEGPMFVDLGWVESLNYTCKELILINIIHIGNIKTFVTLLKNILDIQSILNIQCDQIKYYTLKKKLW